MIKHLPTILAALILISLFYAFTLPHYETLTDGMEDESQSYISQYPNPDQSGGFFGGGYYTAYNGPGSLIALINLGICTFLFILLFIKKVQKRLVNILLLVFLITRLLTFLSAILAVYFLSEPDKLLVGHYWLLIGGICLFSIVYYTKKFYSKKQLIGPLDDDLESSR